MNSGQTIIVLGGGGAVGQGIVASLLQAGATVHVPARSPGALERLASLLDPEAYARLTVAEIDIGHAVDARRFLDDINQDAARIDGVIASLGGWRQGAALADYEPDDWADVLRDNLTSHFDAARLFLPMLTRQPDRPCYLMINGGAALQPAPHAGPMSIAAAAQSMMARVLAAENAAKGVRVNQLILNTPIITHQRPKGPNTWLTAEDVGALCSWLMSSHGKAISGAVWTLDAKSVPADRGES